MKKKNSLFENILMIIISIILFVIAILTNLDKITFNSDKQTLIIVILYIGAVCSLVSGILGMKKYLKTKKSVYYVFKNEFKKEEILSKMSMLEISPEQITVSNDVFFEIIVNYGDGEFNLMIDEEAINIAYYANDDYFDNLDNNMQEIINNMSIKLSPFEVTKEDVIKKFVNFIFENKEKL